MEVITQSHRINKVRGPCPVSHHKMLPTLWAMAQHGCVHTATGWHMGEDFGGTMVRFSEGIQENVVFTSLREVPQHMMGMPFTIH